MTSCAGVVDVETVTERVRRFQKDILQLSTILIEGGNTPVIQRRTITLSIVVSLVERSQFPPC